MPLGDENRAVFCRWRRLAGWPFFDNSSGAVERVGRRADSAPAPGLRRVPPARAFGWGFGVGPRCEPSAGVSESGAAPVSGGEVKKSAAAPF